MHATNSLCLDRRGQQRLHLCTHIRHDMNTELPTYLGRNASFETKHYTTTQTNPHPFIPPPRFTHQEYVRGLHQSESVGTALHRQ